MSLQEYYNKAEFAKKIGITPQLLYRKEHNGELSPSVGKIYSQGQVDSYIKSESSERSIFAENIKFMLERYSITPSNLSKSTKVELSTITRILDGTSRNHRKSSVGRIALFFGYLSKEDIIDIQYKYLQEHTYINIPIYNQNLSRSFSNHIRYICDEDDVGSKFEIPHCAIPIPEKYKKTFLHSNYLIVIFDAPLIGDTVIYRLDDSINIGFVDEVTRSDATLTEIKSSSKINVDRNNIFAILKSNE
jgi:transcriptional regulator with XRE-family HTH domain